MSTETRFTVTTNQGTPIAKRTKFATYEQAYWYMLSESNGTARITATDIGYIAVLGDESWKSGERIYQSAGFDSFI